MISRWLKTYLPRGLYGRAALILILPIVTIQLAVSIVFIQRHYEDVTEQMTTNVIRELRFLMAEIDRAETLSEAHEEIAELNTPLGLNVELPAPHAITDGRLFYDLSGRVVTRLFREALPNITAIDLMTYDKQVLLMIPTRHGDILVRFDRNRVSASNPHQLLVLMIFVGLLLTVIAFLFLRNQLRPIKRLAVASEAFGKGLNLPYRPSGALEVRAAGGAFLDMRERIERQIEQRTRMLSGVSHDLRTPLTRMRLGLSMMEEGADRTALENDIADMERMLDAFLTFAKGAAEDEPLPMEAREIAATAVERAVRAGGAVALRTPDAGGGITLYVRPLLIDRALDNIIGNAVRYAPRAELSVLVDEASVTFRVEDNGPGIAVDDRAEAIRPFVRLEPARNQNRATGTGLGLSIAADAARSHGGALTLGSSERLGGLLVDFVVAR